MLGTLIDRALKARWIVLIAALVLSASGLYAFVRLPIDAYPDIGAQTVWVVTTYPGRAPEEIERRVTIPLEIAMRNVPRVETVRSETTFGLSLVQLIFEEGTETYWARQRVQERLTGVDLPDGASPDLAPVTSPCGEILRYELTSDGTVDLMERRTLDEWVVIPRLLRVPGVADVSNFGGLAKQYAVTYQPARLEQYGLTLDDLVSAIQTNNTAAGGSVLRRGSMSLVIRSSGLIENVQQIENIFVKSVGGTPVYLRDVAEVGPAALPRSSIYSKDRTDESIEGIVLQRRGENPSEVLVGVKEAIEELNATELPKGVRIEPFYDRQHLVDATMHTVGHSVALGIALVVLVLLLFLRRPAMAALIALTIPFALLCALVLMVLTNIPIGLLSVGAIDFGIIVDGAVIIGENIARRLGEATLAARARGEPRPNVVATVRAAAHEVSRPVFFSMLMVIAAYIPLLALTSIEGLLFRPMALTMVFALCGALLFALFLVPVLATLFFRDGYEESEGRFARSMYRGYESALRRLLARRWLVVAVVVGVLAVVGFRVVPRLGVEFLPYLDEGPVWIKANFPEGTALEQTAQYGHRIREVVLQNPDVQFISMQVGRTEAWTEPFPPSYIEMMVGLKPQGQWTQSKDKPALVEDLAQHLRAEFPTTRFVFTQPIIDMVTQDTNGTSANLGVQFSGADSDVLLELGRQMVALLQTIPGARDVNLEQSGPQAQLQITPNRARCARYNVPIEEVAELIDVALGGEPVDTLYEGDRSFDIVVKLDPAAIASPQAIGRLLVHSADGQPVPLNEVAKIEIVDGQTVISRENSRRLITARCDIVGRDSGSFVKEAQERFAAELAGSVPDGYHVDWMGMFQNLERAFHHFSLLIPAAVALIFLLLWATFGSLRSAFLVLASIPFACIGGILALYARDMPMSTSTGVGLAALFGISIMNGVLMVRGITVARQAGVEFWEAIVQGAGQRLRAILIAAIVAIFGLLPASMATGLGSDVQRPLATVIVWGLFSSTLLTLFVVPVLYGVLKPSLGGPGAGETGGDHLGGVG
ncbi:MAG: CusA/CzcA family heavy metal efflux RND transporter [Pseudomonadota bacterium]